MDIVDLEAMLVRARRVRRLIYNGTLTGEQALSLVVAPPPQLLAASLETARENGVSNYTKELFAARAAARRGQ